MKLTIDRKLGYIQCRGGRFLTVVKDHRVSTDTWSRSVDESYDRATIDTRPQRPPRFTTPDVVAVAGDLALEIVVKATDKVVGVAYLSGPAMCLHTYNPFPADWFSDVMPDVRRADIAPTESTPDEIVASILRCAYARARLILYEVIVDDRHGLMVALAFNHHVLGLAPQQEEFQRHADVIVVGRGPKGGGGYGLIHSQIPSRASEWPVQPFHADLCMTSPHAAPWNCRDAAAFELEVGQFRFPTYEQVAGKPWSEP